MVYFHGFICRKKLSFMTMVVNTAEFLDLRTGSNHCGHRRNCINLIVRIQASWCVLYVHCLMPALNLKHTDIWQGQNTFLLIHCMCIRVMFLLLKILWGKKS